MAVFLLIRHAHNDMVGRRLAGRLPHIHLNDLGRAEAQELAGRLSHLPIRRIFSSPLERCLETVQPLALRLGVEVNILEELNEVDLGDWTGRSFDELDREAGWRLFNTFRSRAHIPNGELMVEVQKRMVAAIEGLREKYPEDLIAIFSHGDPIRAAISHYAGIPLDFILRLEIGLASCSALSIGDGGPLILCINNTGGYPYQNIRMK